MYVVTIYNIRIQYKLLNIYYRNTTGRDTVSSTHESPSMAVTPTALSSWLVVSWLKCSEKLLTCEV